MHKVTSITPAEALPSPCCSGYMFIWCISTTICRCDVMSCCCCYAGRLGLQLGSWKVWTYWKGPICTPRTPRTRNYGPLPRTCPLLHASCEILTDLGRSGRRPPTMISRSGPSGLQRPFLCTSKSWRTHARLLRWDLSMELAGGASLEASLMLSPMRFQRFDWTPHGPARPLKH
jgi:hypothetical protein